jgi:probable HAF family extracellular repeat protein
MIDLGTLGGARSEPVALNDRGDVVGTSQTASGETQAFLWRDGQMTALASLGGPSSGAVSTPADINNWGQVVGTSAMPEGERQAVLWHGGSVTDLGALVEGETSVAADVNDRGQIVGWVLQGDVYRAVLWTTFPLWRSAWR